ncbi:adenylate/guanylate cyclase domain-containing protein [uncultured Nocardioides sp.]|uniref:adenylate/guanylate cyclase domain-containing protein n=1 Tax=uncultured Nocardioides sp. TaxID=198441 RepID=UPI002617E2E6|nr:adenylate/guanylate cyclase domain-containing protein [uncultured Nocardioides sp.]
MGNVGGAVLPTGTVTLVFSDIEASTAMVHALGDDWARVLEQQRRLCRRAWSRHGGHELATEGDSFMVVFASPRDAVAAGLRVQASIAQATWPEGARVRVRVGVHTGTPTRHADGYVGMDVHRAARVAAAAHGGQLLVSESTMRLVAEALPDSVVTRDLGEHQLKDIPTRTRLFQLSPAGADADFPPLRTLGGAGSLSTSVREGTGSLVGRDGEVAELVAALDGGARLVTLTGPGGVGKSTLATAVSTAVAEGFADGVFVVPMSGVSAAVGMWAALSQVLDAPPEAQVPPAFLDHVRHRRLLLLLDNLEQIADADQVVADLLDAAPGVSVVATSRRPLHLAAEHEHAVLGLEPEDAESLFAARAARARRGFVVDDGNRAEVRALCTALDRLPLAIEIAAARVRVLSPQAMLARLDSSLDLTSAQRLREGRQASLRDTIAWSFDLLDPTRRRVLVHLGVFVGGASLNAVAAVVPPDALDGEDLLDVLFDLVDCSMVVAGDTDDGEPRFGLMETVRRFALDRLEEGGGRPEAERRHGQHHLDLVRRLHADLAAGDYRGTRATFVRELANVDATLARPHVRLVWDGTDVPPAHRYALAGSLALELRFVEDARQWLGSGLALARDDRLAEAWLHSELGRIDSRHGDAARALERADRALPLVEGEVLDGTSPPWRSGALVAVEAAYLGALSAVDLGLVDRARADHQRMAAFAEGRPDPLLASLVAEMGAYLAEEDGDLPAMREQRVTSQRLRREAGLPPRVHDPNNLADVDNRLGRHDRAHALLAEHVDLPLERGDPYLLGVYAETMAEAVGQDHPALCVRVYAASAALREVVGLGEDDYGMAETERVLDGVRPLMTSEEYDAAWRRGTTEPLDDLLREMAALPTVAPGPGAPQ